MKIIGWLSSLGFRTHMLFSVGVGIIVGVLTVLGQGVLPGNWGSLANSGTVWLIPAFFVGGWGPSKLKSAVASTLSLCGMIIGYYGYAMMIQDIAHSIFYILVWTGAAILGGLIFGMAGYLWGQDQGRKHKYGSALIGGVFITEGLDLYLHIDDYGHMLPVGAVKIIFGLILLVVLERSNKERVSSLLALVPVIVLGLIGYQILHSIT
ncbi:DUF6518 family protein [Paenibacillus sacheonensis]|uniref:Uncharacterized protein n=1 Tax=Paenibacillus sacheonensis TaxID=742054 RepID=A0A7X5C1I0_9BACL|nr:DUF6518 family protein [Paenibacillus sacheonensis]NBC72721.1 hypothetical protein [Paenibacillus sacheonensis]